MLNFTAPTLFSILPVWHTVYGDTRMHLHKEVTMPDTGYANPQLLWTAAELHGRLNDPRVCGRHPHWRRV